MKDRGFLAFVLEQLAGLKRVRAKAMFGGFGLYARRVFRHRARCRLYFRTDDDSRHPCVEAGMQAFAPNSAP